MAVRTTTTRQCQDTPVDVRLVLSALWVAMLFVFAYVDIFGFFRADVLEAALDGTISGAGFTVDQTFLTLTLVYILVPALMVVLSLLLPPAQALTALWFFRLFPSVDSFAAGAIAVFGMVNAVAILGSAALLATALDAAGDASLARSWSRVAWATC